jgi:hypothetical protein
MVKLQIPKSHIPGFKELAKVDEAQVKTIVDFLSSVPVGSGPSTFKTSFDERFSSSSFGPSLAVLIYSFGGFHSGELSTVSPDEIIASLTDSAKSQIGDELNDTDYTNLATNLKAIIFGSDRLILTFKAFSLMADHKSVFRSSQSYSDIRMIFTNNAEEAPKNALIIHQLKLVVEEDEEEKIHYLTLTNSDLQKLKKVIERAEKKEETLRANYSTDISFINITE